MIKNKNKNSIIRHVTVTGLVLLAFVVDDARSMYASANATTTIAAAATPTKIITRRAQEESEVCGCSPSAYEFTLDYSNLSCDDDDTIATGPKTGVLSVSCLISPFGSPTSDLVPVVVDSISVLELDQISNALIETRIDRAEFLNGDTFTYTSILNDEEGNENFSARQIPKALQLNLNARNKDGVMLINVFIIAFSNACGIFPVIQDGDSVGWVVFVSSLTFVSVCNVFPCRF